MDFVTVGETMLRLDVDPVASLENLDRLQVYVAGTESNVATALARLGLRAAWISKLPATPLGRLVERTVRMHGVDTSRVVWDAAGRLGLYFSHIAPLPRPQTILYDRQGSSFTRLDEEEVNWSFVRRLISTWKSGVSLMNSRVLAGWFLWTKIMSISAVPPSIGCGSSSEPVR